MHMTQGSTVTYRTAPESRWFPSAAAAARRARTSACPVGSWSATLALPARPPLLPTRRLSQNIRKRLASPGTPKPLKDVDRRQRLRGLLHILADKWLHYLVHVRPRLVRGEVVVLDRYFYDLLTFPHPLVRRPWLETALMRLIPEPALAFSLTADPHVIAARKRELTVAETACVVSAKHG